MAHRFVSLVVAGVTLFAGSQAASSAQSRGYAAPEVEILVNGTPQKRYAHQGRWYVEALKGREYAIRLRNPYPVRVGVALSVDGLNTIDARHTGAGEARKWVLGPYETVTISGWQTSRMEARRFEFTTEEKSYGEALGVTANLGVISAVFFKERAATIVRETSRQDRQSPATPAAPAAEASRQGQGIADAESLAKLLGNEEYAATGMGQSTDHAVREVWLDLEQTPARTVNVRYEYRSQLVRLGILPTVPVPDPLQRRERARGFEPGFSPEPPRR